MNRTVSEAIIKGKCEHTDALIQERAIRKGFNRLYRGSIELIPRELWSREVLQSFTNRKHQLVLTVR